MADPAALIDVRGWVGERGGLLLWGPLGGALAVSLAGWPTSRRMIRTPPLATVRRLS